ncbi:MULTISPECIES: NAD-dependent epimerase/dehydratase family protein [Mycobacterium]|uniref:NAD-dependent epimerase/dehydratase n=1 Tax=Mycobacterium indicus pranii (strain DSM 45239 / MTCC 9506) TaxID=1232724 RepID=J9WES9_MYCIP|nr:MULTISPECIES: NAD-dependent epimerase/dehydratase family protein [Mycobacterium]AFS15769.1 NAD-dependent epimerase/dehydratase [Mycobacterium intracellulare subsp. intracellulare MTCC 9506]ASW86692.1 epimerase [Mycobacterium intracellulare]EUA31545.1 NAD dependent epimerase/dehydratase family protein [Mycobacterium intracellulare]WRU81112.1 NAD-dependent epimerase/dehydratase family protein [Mycobacterium sp. 5-140-3-2]WSE42736.1 NAD-dependent epimerase/dehydratase family protein [Mycobacte
MPKRIVITGASGNVGTALLRRLTADDSDYEIVGISRRRPPSDDVYRSAHWHELDLADPGVELELLKVFRGAACVVHLAWGFQPTRNRRYLDAVGVNGSAAVLSAAHNAKVPHLLHMSSVGTYAAGRYGQKVDETFSTAGIPSSAYSRAKSAVEHMLDGYERHNPDGVGITRMRPGFILQRDAALGLRRYTLPAYVDPRWVRWLPLLPLDRSLSVSIVHADDVADACVKAIERRALGPFNLAAEPPVGRDDIAKALRARPIHVASPLLGLLVAASWRARLQPLDRGWLDMAFSLPLLGTDRARNVLGWSPRWSSEAALADLVDGFLHTWGTQSPVLRARSCAEAISRDLHEGPLTVRRVP